MWDVGGQDRLRPLWRHYFPATTALIFVIDSQDMKRLNEAKEELYSIIGDKEMEEVVLLVLANKQDLKGSMNPQEISDYLELKSHLDSQLWCVIGSNALTGQGLVEGLSWITNNTKTKDKNRATFATHAPWRTVYVTLAKSDRIGPN